MALMAYWYHIQPMFWFVTIMVMVMFCLFATIDTFPSRDSRQITTSDCHTNYNSRSILFWKFLAEFAQTISTTLTPIIHLGHEFAVFALSIFLFCFCIYRMSMFRLAVFSLTFFITCFAIGPSSAFLCRTSKKITKWFNLFTPRALFRFFHFTLQNKAPQGKGCVSANSHNSHTLRGGQVKLSNFFCTSSASWQGYCST